MAYPFRSWGVAAAGRRFRCEGVPVLPGAAGIFGTVSLIGKVLQQLLLAAENIRQATQITLAFAKLERGNRLRLVSNGSTTGGAGALCSGARNV